MNPTTYIDVTCCGDTVAQLRMVLPHGSSDWFLAPGGQTTFHAVRGGRESMDTGVTGTSGERARWRFRCESCETEVPARDDRLRVVAETLRSFGVPSVPLKELSGILKKS